MVTIKLEFHFGALSAIVFRFHFTPPLSRKQSRLLCPMNMPYPSSLNGTPNQEVPLKTLKAPIVVCL